MGFIPNVNAISKTTSLYQYINLNSVLSVFRISFLIRVFIDIKNANKFQLDEITIPFDRITNQRPLQLRKPISLAVKYMYVCITLDCQILLHGHLS